MVGGRQRRDSFERRRTSVKRFPWCRRGSVESGDPGGLGRHPSVYRGGEQW
jgi:hypothetical protein